MKKISLAIEEEISIYDGTSFALYSAKKDKEYLEKYQDGTLEDIVVKKGDLVVRKEDIMPSIKALELLQKLGYPMNELGTYLYKELIVYIAKEIQDLGKRDDDDKYKAIILGLQNALSGSYHFVARERLDMSVKAFHLYIQKAILLIKKEKADKDLIKRIYGNNTAEIDYGFQAFQLAAFLCGKYSYDMIEEAEVPKIKKVSNMPGNIKLKYEQKV